MTYTIHVTKQTDSGDMVETSPAASIGYWQAIDEGKAVLAGLAADNVAAAKVAVIDGLGGMIWSGETATQLTPS